jgi:bifunctional phosphoglucose/phosphomannose isomerase
LDAFRAVREERKHIAVVAGGGTLLEEARRAKIPTVEIPEHGLPPRLAIGYSVKALLAFIGEERALAQMTAILLPDSLAAEGNTLAERLKDAIPLIYTSRRMGGLAYYWKVVLNETAKLHAFANVFPEAGHNEIEGFSAGGGRASGAEASRFACITLTDPEDDPRVRQRLALFSRTCREKEIPIVPLSLSGANVWERMFRSVVLANWTAYHLARARDVNPLATPLIEAWKRELRG